MTTGIPVGPCRGYQDAGGDLGSSKRVHCPGCAESASLREQLAEANGRRFPVMDNARYSVPWASVVAFDGQAKKNHDQDLEKLASRGGLSSVELIAVIKGHGIRWVMENGRMAETQARARVFELLDLDAAGQPSLRARLATAEADLAKPENWPLSALNESNAQHAELCELRATLRTAEALALANGEARERAEAEVATLRAREATTTALNESGAEMTSEWRRRALTAGAELRGLAEEVRAELQNHALLPVLQRKLRTFLVPAATPEGTPTDAPKAGAE